jgi:PKD-like domain
MTYKPTRVLAFLLALACTTQAQITIPCPSTVPPADNCANACIYCDFNGIAGTTRNYTAGVVPGFCGAIENDQWLGFIANCNSMTIFAIPSNCDINTGLQIAVYGSCADTIPLACKSDFDQGLTPTFITFATVPGQDYFLVVDGFAGDQCDFTITVVPPNCATAPLIMPTLPINGPSSICPSNSGVFTVPAVNGASHYIWDGPPGSTINGNPPPVTLTAPSGNMVTITTPSTPSSGNFEICVQPTNTCHVGNTVCKDITIMNSQLTIFPTDTICTNDLPFINPWGDTITATGLYATTVTTPTGCIATLQHFLIVRPPNLTVLPPQFVCNGGSVTVCGQVYTQGGSYTAVCPSVTGCDSTVQFTVIQNSPVAGPYVPSVLMQPSSPTASDGSLTCPTIPNATAYTWYHAAGLVVGNTQIVTGLPSGTYYVAVRYLAGSGNPNFCTIQSVSVILQATSDLAEAPPSVNQLSIQPNPAQTHVRVLYKGVEPIAQLSFTTPEGRQVKQVSDYKLGDEVDVRDLAAGWYSVTIRLSSGEVAVQKMVIMR